MLKKYIAVLFLSFCAGGVALADTAQYDAETRMVAQHMIKRLGAALKKELGTNSPEGAIGVCRDLAPQIANQLSLETGWKVTRVGTRVRNPMIGTPDVWEQGVLADFEQRLRTGAKPETLEFSQIVDEPGGKFFRYMKALPTQGMCVACHGAPADMADGIKAALARQYPRDKATGYREGELRGAVSVKRPL